MVPRRRILFLDAYDSFSNNITSLLATELGDGVDVFVLPIDSPLLNPASPTFAEDLRRELGHYDAVVCGPGPGSPDNDEDVGLMRCVWDLAEADVLPVLGICLGFQSLVASCGGTIRRLRRGLHGMVRRVDHCGVVVADGTAAGAGNGNGNGDSDIFAGVCDFKATLYHSLCADVGQDGLSQADWKARRWAPLPGCPALVPLAWVEEERDGGGGCEKDAAAAERILMAVRHARRPYWGLQYHPESVCTDDEGHKVVRNWFREATAWNRERGRRVVAAGSSSEHLLARNATWPSLLSRVSGQWHEDYAGGDRHHDGGHGLRSGAWREAGRDCEFFSRAVELPGHVQAPDVVEILLGADRDQSEHIILDSSNASVPLTAGVDVRGKYSVVAMDVSDALRVEYHTGDSFADVRVPSESAFYSPGAMERVGLPVGGSIWQLLAEFHEARRISGPDLPDLPFLGGFMGYITYEQGLAGIGVRLAEQHRGHRRPDVCLAWVTRSIVIDHVKGLLHVQELRPRAGKRQDWIESTVARLQASQMWKAAASPLPPLSNKFPGASIQTPAADEYEDKVKICQEFIAAGDSYELCLTDQTTITRCPRRRSPTTLTSVPNGSHKNSKAAATPAADDSWDLYRTLRTKQPAPFASYIRLGPATLISSSPERFLQHDRAGLCSMKPMKGTVRKSGGAGAVATLAQAEALLHVPKEEAENLMIVDLVRHDLHGVCGAGNVCVPHLLVVEEYQSVFTMITVVEGRLPEPETEGAQPGGAATTRHTGLDVLAASLPPGSMTGAPKKRSCELLQEIEGRRERSLYSGVVGYMCVSGRGDWSVTIRSMFRWDDEGDGDGGEGKEVWRVGAGGAVTILSTPEGEREEMFTKLGGPLSIFS